jgi:hypothetical protein
LQGGKPEFPDECRVIVSFLKVLFENKIGEGKEMLRDNNRGDEFDRSALHTFMEILQ